MEPPTTTTTRKRRRAPTAINDPRMLRLATLVETCNDMDEPERRHAIAYLIATYYPDVVVDDVDAAVDDGSPRLT